ncbi:MAG: manganese efflux pump [Oscillospiraceae bacterium]|nr:manganese efflux pump [Oscillospiraceae bacterium]
MDLSFAFLLNSVLLGVGLAMDAFTVSIANGLHEPHMKTNRKCLIAGTFAGFQALMPMIGWICVHTVVTYFSAFSKLIPWIALILLGFIGGKMIVEALKKDDKPEEAAVSFKGLIVQGIATAIDALSVGFTIADYNVWNALLCAVIIAAVTFVICIVGISIGKRAGMKLADRATLLGGILLIGIGIEIFISHMFGS